MNKNQRILNPAWCQYLSICIDRDKITSIFKSQMDQRIGTRLRQQQEIFMIIKSLEKICRMVKAISGHLKCQDLHKAGPTAVLRKNSICLNLYEQTTRIDNDYCCQYLIWNFVILATFVLPWLPLEVILLCGHRIAGSNNQVTFIIIQLVKNLAFSKEGIFWCIEAQSLIRNFLRKFSDKSLVIKTVVNSCHCVSPQTIFSSYGQ